VPERIQLSRAKGWRMPPNTVKVDRTTPWGNPFVVGRHGTQEQCVKRLRYLLGGYMCISSGPDVWYQDFYVELVRQHIEDLRGKNLACWCRRGTPCHADLLLEIANRP
jgi:hypothetical protein